MGIHGPHKRSAKPAAASAVKKAELCEPPGELNAIGAAAWRKLGAELAARGPLTPSDYHLLGVACQLTETWALASEEVRNRPDPGSIRSQLAVGKQLQSVLSEMTLTRRTKSAAGVVDSKPVFPWGPGGDWDRKTTADIEREEHEDAELARFLGS